MDQTTIILLFLSLVAGLLLGFILGFFRGKSNSRLTETISERDQWKFEAETQRQRITETQEDLRKNQERLESLREEKDSWVQKATRLEEARLQIEKRLEEHKLEVETMRERMNKDFQVLANKIFEEKTEKFSSQSRNSLDQILNPLKEKIKEFEEKVERTNKEAIDRTSTLRTEIKNLKELSSKMSQETENLTNALRNDSRIQGNWGEMILENILESSGLQKDREYFLQAHFTDDAGQRRRPDVLIKLPDDKWVIVDSKVSLKAYEDFVNEGDENQREKHLRAHLQSIRNHISGLSKKKYQEFAAGKNLDFILMFVPVEPAYLLALHRDQEIFNMAYEQGIVMVSPTTLIASLKIIHTTWRHEYQNQNALDIANRGKLLLEKFVNFAENFEKVGEQLNRTQRTYEDSMNQLRDGRGSLVSQARMLEDLGVKSSKKLSDNLLKGLDE
jgi:DNA recombination protein RmuC